VLAYFRRSSQGETALIAVNLTPVPRHGYRIGVPGTGRWVEIMNTDSDVYGGSGQGNLGGVDTESLPAPHNGRSHSVDITIPPLGVVVLLRESEVGAPVSES
jgi:1,4-alpha-glucan branching enzyme